MLQLWITLALFGSPLAQDEPPPRTADAVAALRAERWGEARDTLEAVVGANPHDGLARYYLGIAREALDLHAEALPELRAALALGVDGSRRGLRGAHLALARTLAATGDVDGALTHVEEAWSSWGFDDIPGLLTDEAYAPLHAAPRLRALARLDDTADRSERWRADLRYFQRLVSEAHPDPFRTTSAETWNARVEALAAAADEASDLEITGELMRLAALIGDGHTAVYPPTEGAGAWHLLPFVPVCLSDGWFVAAAPAELADIVGAQLVGAGGSSWDALVRFATERVAADNDFTHRWLAGVALQFAELYALAGATEDATRVSFDLVLPNGRRTTRTLEAGPILRDPNARAVPEGWATAYAEAPLWLEGAGRPFHHRILDGVPGAVYAQINQTADARNQTLAGYGRELREFFEQDPSRALVLDLRLNNGGNAYEARRLVNELLRIPALEEPGRLLVLIGPRTFSATGYLLGMLEQHLAPVRLGWPSGCRPVGPSSERTFRLPHSRLSGSVSWELRVDGYGTDDRRPFFVPDWVVWPSGADLRAGRDPVLEAARACLR